MAAVVVVLCFWVVDGVSLPAAEGIKPALAVSLGHFFLGLAAIVTQRNILKQVFGYCLMENGSHLTLALLAAKAPEVVEIGIATDAVFAVVIMGRPRPADPPHPRHARRRPAHFSEGMTAMVPSILPPLMLAVPLVAAISIALLPAREGGNRNHRGGPCRLRRGGGARRVAGGRRVLAGADLSAIGGWFVIDPLAAIFVALIGLVGLLTGLYAVAYVRHDVAHGELTPSKHKLFFAFFQFFVFTMMLAVTSNNIVLTWVAVEATTLGSAFLVGLYGRRSSLEAAWKYVIICTVGVAFGLYGTVLTFADGAAAFGDPEKAVFWTSLTAEAARLDPMLAKIAFVFVLIGFGTKAGLFPMHGWLPDAHSEAPSPVSALLSGVLLKCALFVVIRYLAVTSRAVGPEFPQMLLLALGFLSVTVAVFLFLVQKDLKRKLAYSSVEHVGLIAIGLGFGGPLGVGAALLHAINHSFAKSLIFCASATC